jgi:hypothetical protein
MGRLLRTLVPVMKYATQSRYDPVMHIHPVFASFQYLAALNTGDALLK